MRRESEMVPSLGSWASARDAHECFVPGYRACAIFLEVSGGASAAHLRYSPSRMVVAFAFVATAVSSLFAHAMLVRYTRTHRPEYRAWAISLAMFALASAALVTGTSTGWDNGAFRVFF